MMNTTLRTKVLAGILCGVITMGTSGMAMAQGVQPTKNVATQKAMATTGVTVTQVNSAEPGVYEILGSGLNSWSSYKVYDKNWNQITSNCSYREATSMGINLTYAPSGQSGDGVILFFDATGNQIGGSVISLYDWGF